MVPANEIKPMAEQKLFGPRQCETGDQRNRKRGSDIGCLLAVFLSRPRLAARFYLQGGCQRADVSMLLIYNDFYPTEAGANLGFQNRALCLFGFPETAGVP